MGSTGSGNFSDFQGHKSKNTNQGGSSVNSECGKAFATDLEDIEISTYYITNNKLPEVNSKINISFNGTRIVALLNNHEIGNLPTKFNYLVACLQDYNYIGIISSTTINPISTITINATPNE